MSNTIRVAIAALLVAFLARPSAAETIGYADAFEMLMGACGQDIENHCGDVRLGSGRIEACLQQHEAEVSAQCRATFAQSIALLDARAQAQAAAPKLCEGDIQRLCRNMRNAGWTLRCLIRPENARRVRERCSTAITDAGWR